MSYLQAVTHYNLIPKMKSIEIAIPVCPTLTQKHEFAAFEASLTSYLTQVGLAHIFQQYSPTKKAKLLELIEKARVSVTQARATATAQNTTVMTDKTLMEAIQPQMRKVKTLLKALSPSHQPLLDETQFFKLVTNKSRYLKSLIAPFDFPIVDGTELNHEGVNALRTILQQSFKTNHQASITLCREQVDGQHIDNPFKLFETVKNKFGFHTSDTNLLKKSLTEVTLKCIHYKIQPTDDYEKDLDKVITEIEEMHQTCETLKQRILNNNATLADTISITDPIKAAKLQENSGKLLPLLERDFPVLPSFTTLIDKISEYLRKPSNELNKLLQPYQALIQNANTSTAIENNKNLPSNDKPATTEQPVNMVDKFNKNDRNNNFKRKFKPHKFSKYNHKFQSSFQKRNYYQQRKFGENRPKFERKYEDQKPYNNSFNSNNPPHNNNSQFNSRHSYSHNYRKDYPVRQFSPRTPFKKNYQQHEGHLVQEEHIESTPFDHDCGIEYEVDHIQEAILSLESDSNNEVFIIDSGSTVTHCINKNLLTNIRMDEEPIKLRTANGSMVETQGYTFIGRLKVYYTPGLTANLLSVTDLGNLGLNITFHSNHAIIHSPQQKLPIPKIKGLFRVEAMALFSFIRNNSNDIVPNVILKVGSKDQENNQNKSSKGVLRSNYMLWHARLHLNHSHLSKLIKLKKVKGIDMHLSNIEKYLTKCPHCLEGKMRKRSYKKKRNHLAKDVFSVIHTDLKGPITPEGPSGEKYMISFICEFSSHRWLYFLKTKDEATARLEEFILETVIPVSKKLQLPLSEQFSFNFSEIVSDGGTEFLSSFDEILRRFGIAHTITPAYTPELNGRVETSWRALMGGTRVVLYQSGISYMYWPYAAKHVNNINNMTRIITKGDATNPNYFTPYELVFKKIPDLSKLRQFGCKCHVFQHEQERQDKNFSKRSIEAIYLGNEPTVVNGALVLYPNARKYKIVDIDNIEFHEIMFPRISNLTGQLVYPETESFEPPTTSNANNTIITYKSMPKTSPTSKEISEKDDSKSINKRKRRDNEEDQQIKHQMTTRPSTKQRYQHLESNRSNKNSKEDKNNVIEINNKKIRIKQEEDQRHMMTRRSANNQTHSCFIASTVMEQVPDPNYTEKDILNSKEWNQWKGAIEKEFNSINKNNVWELCELPNNRTAIITMWIFKKKQQVDGTLTFKARLVILGNRAKPDIDFNTTRTYAPVAKLPSLRVFFSLVVQFKMHMLQLDVETAFQNAPLDQDIYVHIPHFFNICSSNNPNQLQHYSRPALKLLKALYGLPQSPRLWFETINLFLLSIGYESTDHEPCIYILKDKYNRTINMLVLYVDDMILASTSHQQILQIQQEIENRFKIKTLGQPKKILGININYNYNDGILTMHQTDKIIALTKQFKLERANGPSVPINHTINYDKVELFNTDYKHTSPEILKEYQSLLGHLMYIMVSTRPDIAYAVSKFAQYLQQPTAFHLHGVKNLVKYIYTTRNLSLMYKRKTRFSDYSLVAFADSDWATDIKNRRSHTGGLLTLGNTPIMWISTLQTTVSLSSAEAEIKALKEVVRNVLWIRQLIMDTKLIRNLPSTTIFEDNQATIRMVSNPEVSIQNRHTDIAYRFITENITQFRTISLQWIPTHNNVADMFTKPLNPQLFAQLRDTLYHCDH